jgi:hypothetical protein
MGARGQPWQVTAVPTTPSGTFEATLSGITTTTDFFAQVVGDQPRQRRWDPATQLTVAAGS